MRRVHGDCSRDPRVQVAFAEQVIPNDRARVSLEEAVEQRARPSLNDAIAHGVRKGGATDDQLRGGPARDRVLEDDLLVRRGAGVLRRSTFCAIGGGQPAGADPGLDQPLLRGRSARGDRDRVARRRM